MLMKEQSAVVTILTWLGPERLALSKLVQSEIGSKPKEELSRRRNYVVGAAG